MDQARAAAQQDPAQVAVDSQLTEIRHRFRSKYDIYGYLFDTVECSLSLAMILNLL